MRIGIPHGALKAGIDELTAILSSEERLREVIIGELETIKKERTALHEQLDQLMSTFTKEKADAVTKEAQEEQKVGELQQFVFHLTDQTEGVKKQRQIQIELEKTRFIAQIKECETLIADWVDRIKAAQEDLATFNAQFGGQMTFAERIFRDEEQETQLFLHDLQRAMTLLNAKTDGKVTKDAA
jgi:DNA gyrase/topoisomerase IV subunit A